MSKDTVIALLVKCIRNEGKAKTVAERRYWDAQWRRLSTLAKKVGWID